MKKLIISLIFIGLCVLVVMSEANASSILIDRTHGQQFDEQGFSDHLRSLGWGRDYNYVSPITLDLLQDYDVFVSMSCISGWLQSEIDAVVTYVHNGGGLWFAGDALPNPTYLAFDNQLVSQFGVTLNGDEIYDTTNNEGDHLSWATIHTIETHPITNGVSSFGYYSGSSLNVDNQADIIATGDDDTYSSEGFYTAYPPVLAAIEFGDGRVVVIGDATPWYPIYFQSRLREEERLLLVNTAEWLAKLIPKPTISVAPLSHDFGSVVVGEVSNPLDIMILNDGYVNLTVLDISLSDDTNYSLTGDTAVIIEPGDNHVVTTTMNPKSSGFFPATLTVTSDDPDEPNVPVELTGEGYLADGPDLTVSCNAFHCTDFGKSIRVELMIENLGSENAAAFKAALCLSPDGINLGEPLAERTVKKGLKAGRSIGRVLKYSSINSLSGYYIIAVVDSDDEVLETNETNNVKAILKLLIP